MFHPNHPPQIPIPDLRAEIDQVRLLQHQPLTPGVVKNLLRELLDRLEGAENGVQPSSGEEPRCSLHGLWLSAITGVAFQLEPAAEHSSGLKVTCSSLNTYIQIPLKHGSTSFWDFGKATVM